MLTMWVKIDLRRVCYIRMGDGFPITRYRTLLTCAEADLIPPEERCYFGTCIFGECGHSLTKTYAERSRRIEFSKENHV